VESKSSWFFRIKWGLVAGKIRGKEGLTGVDEKHVFFFFGGGGGGFYFLMWSWLLFSRELHDIRKV